MIVSASETLLVDCHKIEEYANLLPPTKRILGVFVTHQHNDHYSGLEYLRNKGFSIGNLIYSPYQRRHNDSSVTLEEWKEFAAHRDYFASKGTKLYTPHRQANFDKAYWQPDGLKVWMLGPFPDTASSDTRELHDACLVFKVDMGARKCTFTGDASDKNLNQIALETKHICDDILHASHHGSLNGADLDFIKKCEAQYTVLSTASGVYENVPHSTALSRYRENTSQAVYRTDREGTLSWAF